MPPKKPVAGDAVNTPAGSKIRKIEHTDSLDFSSSVKKRLSSSSRTGQACDRCKVRKIRCDGRPGGCSPCLANNTACKTTDRITGRATTRGHTEALEIENNYLRQTISELQAQLKDLGKDVKQHHAYTSYMSAGASGDDERWSRAQDDDRGQGWDGGSSSVNNDASIGDKRGGREESVAKEFDIGLLGELPSFKPGCVEGSFLGLSAESVLSPVKGMSLSFFGTEIDLSDFISAESDDASSPLSYRYLITHIFNKAKDAAAPQLPPYEEAKSYSTWYFGSMNVYTPVISQPEFMKLLWRMYNESNFQASKAQTAMVHMVLAAIKYQIAFRNTDHMTQNGWHLHYRYSLTLFFDLTLNPSLEDLQALTMICTFLRNLPKPGPAWFGINVTYAMALELGLHRSVKTLNKGQKTYDTAEIETRKRTFWVLYTLLVNVYGKLGRPIPIRTEDINVELPESYTETSPQKIDPPNCPFQVAIEAQKIGIIYGKMYKTIYEIRQPPHIYEHVVKNLELEVKQWKNQIAPHLKNSDNIDPNNQIHAFFLELFESELQLLSHHPATCRTTNPNFIASNMDMCLSASSKMLRITYELHKRKSLDTPWMQVTTLLAAIFTTLYIHSVRKDEVTSTSMGKLREEMDKWLEIMTQIGIILGSGLRLQSALSNIINQSLDNIGGHLTLKSGSTAATKPVQSARNKSGRHEGSMPPSVSRNDIQRQTQYTSSQVQPNNANASKPTHYLQQSSRQDTQPTSNYTHTVASQNDLSYGDTNTAHLQHYPQQRNTSTFDRNQFALPDHSLAAPMNPSDGSAAAAGASNQFTYAFNAQPQPAANFVYDATGGQHSAWREWTQSIMASMSVPDLSGQPPEYMSSATALMALGAEPPRNDAAAAAAAAAAVGGGGPHQDGGGQHQQQQQHIDPIIAQSQVTGTQLWPAIAYVFGSNEI